MTNLTTHLMLDDIDLAIEARHVTAKVVAIAGYVNGRWANWPAIVAKYGNSGLHLVSIDVQGNFNAGAQCLDVERGDAQVSQAPEWVRQTRKAGMAAKDLRYFPKIYTSQANLQAVVDACSRAGIQRGEYLLWSAHYGQGEHICGPKTCGSTVQADATQFSNGYDGVSLDASLCFAYFFEGPPKPPAPKPLVPPVPKVKVPDVAGKDGVAAQAELIKAGFKVHTSPVLPVPGTSVTHQDPAANTEADEGSTVTLLLRAAPVPVLPPVPPVVTPPVVPSPPVDPPVTDPAPVPTPDPAPAPEPVPDPVPVVAAVTMYAQTVYSAVTTVDVPAGSILFVPQEASNG